MKIIRKGKVDDTPSVLECEDCKCVFSATPDEMTSTSSGSRMVTCPDCKLNHKAKAVGRIKLWLVMATQYFEPKTPV